MAEVLVWVDIFICWLVGRAGCVYTRPSSINGCNTWLAILAKVHRVTSLTWLVSLQQQKSSLSWYFRLLISHPIQFEWINSIFEFVSWREIEVIQHYTIKLNVPIVFCRRAGCVYTKPSWGPEEFRKIWQRKWKKPDRGRGNCHWLNKWSGKEEDWLRESDW